MTTWRVGMKAVCIKQCGWVDRVLREAPDNEICPSYNETYTVRDVVCIDDRINLRFFEIRNEPKQYKEGFNECCFGARHFRPAVSRPTDISIFKELLRNPHQHITEDA